MRTVVLDDGGYRPNHRIQGLKADVLPFAPKGGRGFGSVFRHHYSKNQPLSVGFFSPGLAFRIAVSVSGMTVTPFQGRAITVHLTVTYCRIATDLLGTL